MKAQRSGFHGESPLRPRCVRPPLPEGEARHSPPSIGAAAGNPSVTAGAVPPPFSSAQAQYRAPHRKRRGLLTPLRLLSPRDPLRWARAGAPMGRLWLGGYFLYPAANQQKPDAGSRRAFAVFIRKKRRKQTRKRSGRRSPARSYPDRRARRAGGSSPPGPDRGYQFRRWRPTGRPGTAAR